VRDIHCQIAEPEYQMGYLNIKDIASKGFYGLYALVMGFYVKIIKM
jgi:hypothetical protein